MSSEILTTISEKQNEAKKLIEVDGFQQKEVAKKVGISEKTIGVWILKFKWLKNDEMSKKRNKARQLIVVQGFFQKEAAQIVGVSEKTIGKWVKKYKWVPKHAFEAPTFDQVKFAVNNFLLYVDCTAPGLSKDVRELSERFYTEEPELLALLK